MMYAIAGARRALAGMAGIALVGTASCARTSEMSSGSMAGSTMPMNRSMNQMLSVWPAKQREMAMVLMSKYGQPSVSGDRLLVWYNKGPYKMTALSRDAVPHHFPMPHMDFLAQTVMHNVPIERFDDLAEYDGSVWVHRTRGEITAQCDMEELNNLALNLAHEVAMGRRSVQDARMMYAKTAMAFKQGDRSSPYTQTIMFQQMPNAADPGRPVSP